MAALAVSVAPQIAHVATHDGITLQTYIWQPEATPRALVAIVHGYGEHSLRYQHLAEALVTRGYAVCSHDHRGHGESTGPRVQFESLQQLADDAQQYYASLPDRYLELPFFVYGHSMGSGIALNYALQYQERLAGLLISGTLIDLGANIPENALNLMRPLINMASDLRLIPGFVGEQVTSDPEMAKRYDADPLNDHERVRIGAASAMVAASAELRQRVHQLKLPLLIMHGEEDLVTPLSGSKLLYEQAASSDKTLRTYPSMRHEVINEREREQVIEQILTWLDAH